MRFFGLFGGKQREAVKRHGVTRGYAAAEATRLASTWSGDYGLGAYEMRSSLDPLRRRTREAAKNDPYVVKALKMYANNVVGPGGVKFSCGYMGRKTEEALAVADRIEKAWKLWSESPAYCDAHGRKTLRRILMNAVRSWKREGEAIIQMVPAAGNPFGFSIATLRPDALDVNMVETNLPGGGSILNGVEFDAQGRAVAYHFFEQMMQNGQFCGTRKRVPAKHILHLYDEEYEGQARGIPAFAAVLASLRQSAGYDEAELVAARVDASRCSYFRQTDGGDPAAIGEIGTDALYQQVQPGEIGILPQGWELQTNAPSRPNSGYGIFKTAVMRRIASGLGLPYHTLCNDLADVNYSSIRAGTLEDREEFKTLQQDLIDAVLRPMFRSEDGWLNCAYLAGAISVTPEQLQEIRVTDEWIPRTWPWVDPLRDAEANQLAVSRGWTTDSDVAASQGADYWRNLDTQQQESEWRRKRGIPDSGQPATKETTNADADE